MAFHHNVAGTWKSIVVWMNVAGTWKKCALHHNVAGTWKAITQLLGSNFGATLGGNDFAISPSDASVLFYVNNNGTWSMTGGGSGTWMAGGTASEYEARWTTTSGALSSGTASTWLNLGTTRAWGRNETRNGYYSSSVTGTFEVRMAASPYTVLSTTTVTMTADVEV